MLDKIPFALAKLLPPIAKAVSADEVADASRALIAEVMESAPAHCGRKAQIMFVARALSLPVGMIEAYWYRKRANPPAHEYLNLQNGAIRRAERLNELSRKIEETADIKDDLRKGANGDDEAHLRVLGRLQHAFDGERRGRVAGEILDPQSGYVHKMGCPLLSLASVDLMSLTGRLEFDEPASEVPEHLQRFADAASDSGGEFTPSLVQHLEKSGLIGTTTFYRFCAGFPVVRIGDAVSFLSPSARIDAIGRPARMIPCLPDLTDCLDERLHQSRQSGQITRHAVRAQIGGRAACWTRVIAPLPRSGLMVACCQRIEGVAA